MADRLDQIAEVVRCASRVADWADETKNEMFTLHPCCLDRDVAPGTSTQMSADLRALVNAVTALRGGPS